MSGEAEEYGRAFALLNEVRELPPARRVAYLDEACGGDAALRGRVLALLAAGSDDECEDSFAERSVAAARRGFEEVLASATPDWLPPRIGDYTIVRQIGRGGMGVVYEAAQASPRRRVALKLLHPMQATPERLRRFRHEAELLGRLQHPGIAQIFESGHYDVGRGPQPFFAMELVEGVDIRTHCERHGLERAARIELLARVADAVQYAHERGVIHRDIKPDNVLVDANGNPRILDFGIARASGHSGTLSTLLTEEGQLVGTLAYMAPEQLSQAPDAVTPRVDVYALGVLGFELLVGRLPRELADLSLSQAITLLATSEPAHAGTFDRSLRGDVETILGKALETEPARRYASPGALASDLRRHLAHRPIEARPPSRMYLVRKFTRRHRGLVAGTLTALFALLAGGIAAWIEAHRARDQRDLALASEERASASESQALNGLLQSAQILLDACRERDALTQLRLVPEKARGVAWRFLDRAVPFVIDETPGYWLFVDDEHMVGVRRDLPTDHSNMKRSSLLLYSLVEHRTVRELFPRIGIYRIQRAASCGLVIAVTIDDTGHQDNVLLLDLEREAVLEKGPVWTLRGSVPVPAGEKGAGEIREVFFDRYPETSDDGRTILWYTSASEAEIRVDGKVVRVVRDLGLFEAAHLGPDGKLLVVNRRAEVSALDVTSGAVRFHYAFAADPGASGIPVRGGVLLHSALEDYSFSARQVWRRFELEDGAAPVEPADPFATGFVSPVTFPHRAISYPRDGRFCTASPAYRTGGAFLASTETGAPLPFAVLEKHPEGASWLPFDDGMAQLVDVSPSGCRLAVYGGLAQTKIVELDPRDSLPEFDPRALTLRGHTNPEGKPGSGWIYHLAVSNDGSLIASAAPEDLHIRVWDTRTGECIATLERHCDPVAVTNPGSWEALMAFRADDEHLLVTTPFGAKGLCLVDWNLLTGEVAQLADPLPIDASHLLLLDRFIEALAPKDKTRLSQRVAMQDGRALVAFQPPTPGLDTAKMPRPPEGQRWRFVPAIEGHAPGLCVHPSLPRAAVVQLVGIGVSRMGRLTVLDTRSGEVLAQRELADSPWCAAYSPDGSVLAIGTNLGNVLFFETERYTQQLVWRAHGPASYAYVYSLAWTPDGTRLVTVSGDETVKIWDTRTRVASRLDDERWQALRAEMAARDDLAEALPALAGEQREAARVECILRTHAR